MSLSVSKSMLGLLKKNGWDSRSLSSHSATISSGFHSQNLWGTSLLGTRTLCWRAWGVNGTPHFSGWTSEAKIALPIVNHHM